MPIIDISRPLNPAIAVWPGDTPFQLTRNLSLAHGDSVNLTTLTLSAHTGSHADAPWHFSAEGPTMEQIDLAVYWGLAQVVTVTKEDGPLWPADFAAYDLTAAPRLLVRSPASEQPATLFPTHFVHPSPALAEYLAGLGIILYGSDAPSMDAATSKILSGHQALWRHGIAILESLNLAAAPDGLYELSALPLRIAGGDGSPVRAALRRRE